jgi:RNA polymerase sigma-70 factor (ECF subfamily)
VDPRVEAEMIALLPRLKRFAYALTGTWADAEDLVQDTCARACDRLDQWEAGTRLDSWMYRIAQNLHRNALRQGRARMNHLRIAHPDEIGAESIGAASDRAIDRLELSRVGTWMARLPPEQRAALILVGIEGRGYHEAADILGISPGTVASRISRARSALAGMMNGVAYERS